MITNRIKDYSGVHLITRMQRHSLAVIIVVGSSLQHHDSFAVTVMDVIAKAAARFKNYLSVHYYAVIKHALVKIMFNNYVTIATEAVGTDICFAVCYFHKQSPLFFDCFHYMPISCCRQIFLCQHIQLIPLTLTDKNIILMLTTS